MSANSPNSPTRLHFESRYDDESGVEYGVRYDRDTLAHDGTEGTVTIECAGEEATIPRQLVPWLYERLDKILEETPNR